VINLFYENSTRTRSSFEIAGKYLGADVINITASSSSVTKGESLKDTARTLDQMAPDIIVMRHKASGAHEIVAKNVKARVINAGDGTHQHPSQGLLDLLTILTHKGTINGLKVAIIGDILHSRVARSDIWGLKTFGADVWLCAPPTLLPAKVEQLTETTPTEQPAKTEQPTETTLTEQSAKTEQPTETTLTEQSAKTEQPKQDTKTNTTSQNQSDGIVIDGKTISIGQTVSKLKSDWGEPSRIDQNSYSLERYVYINNYKHFFMVSIKDNKIAEIFTNDMTFQYKGVTGKMDANDITNVRYLDLKNFRAELKEEGKDTFVLLNKDYKAEGILIRTSDYKQQLQLRYSQQFLDNFKTELIDIINSARVQEEAAVLTSDDTAANVAYYHSWDMSKNNYVGYTNQKGENPFDRMTAGGVKYTMAGESVVKIEGEDAINTYHQLMMEAGTRTNLLNPELTHYGLAAFDSNFTIYVTLDLFAPAKE